MNRVGDFGFLLGIIWCYAQFGTTNLDELATAVGGGKAVATGIPLLLFCGAVGKSAQLPLHVWLPDAMEGPTPVSALIHAATMVAAGIYMLCRINVLMVPEALTVIMWIGAATALYAALCAIVQSDIKKVLAYSTLSQLGYMVAAFGLGSLTTTHDHDGGNVHAVVAAAGVGAAMFHLTTHAFFKALMFLGSGSVIHACHHEQDIFKMGGLRKKMPLTFITFTIGVLAIIGMPGLAGFFSKDAILYLAIDEEQGGVRDPCVHRGAHGVLHGSHVEDCFPRRAAQRRRGPCARRRHVAHRSAGRARGALGRGRLQLAVYRRFSAARSAR